MRLSSLPLNAYEKFLLGALIALHLFIGCCLLPTAVYETFLTLTSPDSMWPDFTVYYTAGYIAAHTPDLLYSTSTFIDFYHKLRPGVLPVAFYYFPPPPLAVLLCPLSLLSYANGFLLWAAINSALSLLLAYKIGLLADRLGLYDLKRFFQSCMIGLLLVSNIIIKGQLSLILCFFLTAFLFAIEARNKREAGFWLSFLLLIKPQLFLPLVLCIAGCREWKTILSTGVWVLIWALITLPLSGPHIWLDYIQLLQQYSAGTEIETYYNVMPNLRGLLYLIYGQNQSHLLTHIANGAYIVVCLLSFIVPWLAKKKWDMLALTLIIPLGFFFSTYVQTHDLIVILPLCVIITMHTRARGQAHWMILCYMLGMTQQSFLYCLLLLLLCIIVIHLMVTTRNNSEPDATPEITTVPVSHPG